jgi:hypothetical protein
MLSDALGTFSNQQAITSSAASTSSIDLSATGTPAPGHTVALKRDIGRGNPVNIRVQVTEAFATCDSLKVAIQTDADTAFGSVVTVLETEAIAVADLTVGYVFNLQWIPRNTDERYLRLYYTVAGSNATTGKVFAAVVESAQDNDILAA